MRKRILNDQPESLMKIVKELQEAVKKDGLTEMIVRDGIKRLEDIGFPYDHELYPALANTTDLQDESTNSPLSLAEMFIWKRGDWLKYKKFLRYHASNESLPKEGDTGVVFFAFAKHLRDPSKPIFDQHALRAIWAICELDASFSELCCSVLMDGKGAWRSSGHGADEMKTCYELFLAKMDDFVRREGSATSAQLNLLLMSLGQALKEATTPSKNEKSSTQAYERFSKLCGHHSSDGSFFS